MPKAVMLSIRPRYCEMIAGNFKSIEVRKTRPKLETPFKCYIYCTKFHPGDPDSMINLKGRTSFFMPKGGAVIGEFVCDRIFPITVEENGPLSEERGDGYSEDYSSKGFYDCLTDKEFDAYLNGKPGYGWHISDLVIYDEPKKLSEFIRPSGGCCNDGKCTGCKYFDKGNGYNVEDDCLADFDTDMYSIVTRPPQSYCYVEELT